VRARVPRWLSTALGEDRWLVDLAGAIIEMPVLDHAIPACAVAFTPLLLALTVGEPVMKVVARLTRMLHRSRAPFLLQLADEAHGLLGNI